MIFNPESEEPDVTENLRGKEITDAGRIKFVSGRGLVKFS